MAVTTTVQDVLDAAYGKSLKNTPGAIATEATELLEVVTRALRGLYAAAARLNPMYFSTSADIAFAGEGWTRPDDAESIFRIEWAGTPVSVVPFDDRSAEAAIRRPSVYQLGKVFRPAGNPDDPTSGTLTFFYSLRPAKPASLSSTLDPTWEETFNELLVLEVAIYLALKDGRNDEVALLAADRDRWLPLFAAFLEHGTANEVRRFGHVRRFPMSTIQPLLAGGAT